MSRCQRFDFRRISEAEIIQQMKRICTEEGIAFDEKVFSYIVREADGSMRDAESILDQVIAYSGDHISEKDITDVIGVVERQLVYRIVEAVIAQDAKAGLTAIEQTLEQGYDAYQVYKALVSFLRDVLMIRVWEGKPPFLFIDDAEYKQLVELAKPVEYYEIQNLLNYVLQAEDLVRGAFPKISLEILFINLYNLSRLREVEHVLGGITRSSPRPEKEHREEPRLDADLDAGSETKLEGKPEAETEARPKAGPKQEGADTAIHTEAPPLASQSLERNPKAQEFLEYLKTESPFTSSVLQALEIRVEDGKLVVLLDKKYGFIRKDTNIINELKKQAAQFFGKEVALQFSDANGPKEDSLEDYVKEARSLFNV
jgi:DNA polymerase-3 subunit gamma/tau